jgi:hypothetical protein
MPSKKDGGRRKKIMENELKMVGLNATSKSLAIVFSQDVKNMALKGSYFLASVFSSDPSATEVVPLPDPPKIAGESGNTLVFKGPFREGDLVVVTFPSPHALTLEEIKKIEGDHGCRIPLHSIRATIGGGSGTVSSSEEESPESIEIYDPCIEPESLAWERMEKAAKALEKDGAPSGLESVLSDLKKAHECEDSRAMIQQRLSYRISEIKMMGDDPNVQRFWRAVRRLEQTWQERDQTQIAILEMRNLQLIAEEKFKKLTADKNLSKLVPIGASQLKAFQAKFSKITEVIERQRHVSNQMLMQLDTCAEIDVLTRTREELLRLQTTSEEICCSLVCESQTFQAWCCSDYVEESTLNLGEGARCIARIRTLLEQLNFDPAGPSNQFSSRLVAIKQSIESVGKQISAMNPPIEAQYKQIAQESIAGIQPAIDQMTAQSSALQTITADSCKLIASYRMWAVKVEQCVDMLLCQKALHRCSIRNTLLQIATLLVQVYCFLAYAEKKCKQLAEEQKQTHKLAPAVPSQAIAKVVNQLASTAPGIQVVIPPELIEAAKAGENTYISINDPIGKGTLGIFPVDGSKTFFFIDTPAGTNLEIQGYADGNLVGTVIATAE